jgi:hypothetical protein
MGHFHFSYSNGTQKCGMSTNLKSTDLGSKSSVLGHVLSICCPGQPPERCFIDTEFSLSKKGRIIPGRTVPHTTHLLTHFRGKRGRPYHGRSRCGACQLIADMRPQNSLTDVHGQALRCDDGMFGDTACYPWRLSFEVFEQGRRMVATKRGIEPGISFMKS